jgi:hypothetical protein
MSAIMPSIAALLSVNRRAALPPPGSSAFTVLASANGAA